MSVTHETTAPVVAPTQGDTFSTDFYKIFTLSWTSPQPSTLVFWVTAQVNASLTVVIVDRTTFRPMNNVQSIHGVDPHSGITFQGTITASWHTAASGKLSGDNMLLVLTDGTPFGLSGDIGLWP